MSIMTVVLAAGASTRMGSPKALLDFEGQTLITRIATTARAAGATGVSVVLGPPDGDRIKPRLPPGVAVIWNPDPSRGMLSSVQAGLMQLPHKTLAALIWPVDHPALRTDTVTQIMGASPGRIIVPRVGGEGGHPVRIPRQFFGGILALPADASLKSFIEANAASVAWVDVDDAGAIRDIDTPADLADAPVAAAVRPPENS
jgi:CTP:molybdopterin cytidylyltransferase MocA